jgi:hypothetical protein
MKTMPTKKPDRQPVPRKPAASKRSTTLTVRLRESEHTAIRAAAVAAGLTATDLIVARCCSASRSKNWTACRPTM